VHSVSQALLWHDRQSEDVVERPAPIEQPAQTDLEDPLGSYLKEISRERLLSEVWGYHFNPGSNVVDVCIRRLRKKLGAGAPIETIRHAGYRVTAA